MVGFTSSNNIIPNMYTFRVSWMWCYLFYFSCTSLLIIACMEKCMSVYAWWGYRLEGYVYGVQLCLSLMSIVGLAWSYHRQAGMSPKCSNVPGCEQGQTSCGYVQWSQVGELVCDHITQECDHSYAVKKQWVQMHLVNGAHNRLCLENSVHV